MRFTADGNGAARYPLIGSNAQSGYSSQQQIKLVTAADFFNFARVRDDQFAETLKDHWHDYSILAPLEELHPHKISIEPVFNSSSFELNSPSNLPFSEPTFLANFSQGAAFSYSGIRKPSSERFSAVPGKVLFYGQQINFRYDTLLALSPTRVVSEDSISVFWLSFSRSNSTHLIDQLMDYRDRLGLNDWGYYQLVKMVSASIVASDRWKGDQLTWGLMIRSGFDVRLAFNQNNTTVLIPSAHLMYDKQSVIIDKRRYFLDRELKSQLLITCPNPFPDAMNLLDLKFSKALNFSGKLANQKFRLNWKKMRLEFNVRNNPELIHFYNDYPKTDMEVYLEAPASSIVKEDILRQLYPSIAKMNRLEAASMLQHFVQREIEYCSSGSSTPISRFAEEVIATKSGADGGKSSLFAWLIRTLIHLPVIGVQFPGFCSTAICFNESVEGDAYLFKKRKYLIADPTYQNLPPGILMPEFVGLKPQLIDPPVNNQIENNGAKIWEMANNMGASRGGASQDILFDSEGHALLTGSFGIKPFIACFSESNTLQWIRKFEGDGRASSFAIAQIHHDEIYIAGVFSGKLQMDGQMIQTTDPGSLFIAQFNHLGELIWIKNIPYSSLYQEDSFPLLVKIGRSGNLISFQQINEDERNIKYGFVEAGEAGLVLIGSRNLRTLASTLSNSPRESLPTLLKIVQKLNRLHCNSKVTGVLAILEWLNSPGHVITGSQIQSFCIQINPSFAAENGLFFELLGRISLLKNEQGVITITTKDHKSLYYNTLRFENKSQFQLSDFDNGDRKIDLISGVTYAKNPLLLELNNLVIDFSDGNLQIDYDFDHTLKTISVRPFAQVN
jgi:hypothetical protein